MSGQAGDAQAARDRLSALLPNSPVGTYMFADSTMRLTVDLTVREATDFADRLDRLRDRDEALARVEAALTTAGGPRGLVTVASLRAALTPPTGTDAGKVLDLPSDEYFEGLITATDAGHEAAP